MTVVLGQGRARPVVGCLEGKPWRSPEGLVSSVVSELQAMYVYMCDFHMLV